MESPNFDVTMKKDTTMHEHVEDHKDRINVDFQQNVNAKYSPLPIMVQKPL